MYRRGDHVLLVDQEGIFLPSGGPLRSHTFLVQDVEMRLPSTFRDYYNDIIIVGLQHGEHVYVQARNLAPKREAESGCWLVVALFVYTQRRRGWWFKRWFRKDLAVCEVHEWQVFTEPVEAKARTLAQGLLMLPTVRRVYVGPVDHTYTRDKHGSVPSHQLTSSTD